MALIMVIAFSTIVFAVQAQEHNDPEEHGQFKNHRISAIIGHTFVPNGEPDVGRSGTVIVPSWGLDYEYWFNHKWAIGFHSDLELISYVVDNQERQELERERPVILSLVGLFKPVHQLVVYIGPGIELEKNENFFVFRLGVEYEFEIGHHWDLSPGFFYDNKEGIFDSWSLGLAVARRF